jgi:translation initiation factor 3 subunit J
MVKDQWDDEDAASGPEEEAAPPVRLAGARRKFDDEEDDDDVLDSWDAEEDEEEVERKAKAAAEAKAKAEAEAAANKKSKLQRIAEHQEERARARAEAEEEDGEEETEAERRERLRRSEKEADLAHAEDLFGGVGANVGVGRTAPGAAGAGVVATGASATETVNLGALPLFNPSTKADYEALRATLAPLLLAGSTKKTQTQYVLFLQEFIKQLSRELPSDQIKKIASGLTALSNERIKEEKAGDKSKKKSKAQQTKTTLLTTRAKETDLQSYDDIGDDDFM